MSHLMNLFHHYFPLGPEKENETKLYVLGKHTSSENVLKLKWELEKQFHALKMRRIYKQ